MSDPRAVPRRVVVAGGSGFLGRALTRALRADGRTPVVLTRSPRARDDGVIEVAWDGRSVGEWSRWLDGAEAVVNLAGRSVDCRWNAANRREIIASRVDSVAAIAGALAACAEPPLAWVQASAVGFYGEGEELRDETSHAGTGFLADVCRAWEDAFARLRPPAVRGTALRIGFVLGRDGGGLPLLARLARWCLGGSAGSGRQWLSWIHIDDLVAVILREESIATDISTTGLRTINAVSPQPLRNRELMAAVRRIVGRPWAPPAPAAAVRLGAWLAGSAGSLALSSIRVSPRRLIDGGFRFGFPDLDAALRGLLQE